jgi:hypothetical protein
MAGEIKLNIDGLARDVQVLEHEIANFERLANVFLDRVINNISPLNSDFISRISTTMNNMRSNNVPELLSELHEYVESIEIAQRTFAEADETIANINESR